ncbi:MAG: tripartite tricarboxylate transporter TctB family protein [bacterium]|nr:tripartite tricarboxylate transporter TctB family protein [bacterium]
MEALFEGIGGLYAFIAVLVVMLAALTFLIRTSAATRQFLGNILIPSALIAIGILCYLMTRSFPKEEAGPSAIPHLWIVVLIILSIFLIFQALTGKMDPDPKNGRLDMLALFVGVTIAYLLLMQVIGYYLSTFLFLVAVMYFLSYRKYVTMFAVSGGWLLFAYLVFQRMLYIPLPQGKFIEMILE